MSSELRFGKWVKYFERNCIVKWVIFFARFCWFWDFLLDNLKIKKIFWWCPQKRVDEYKTLHARNNIFKKIILNMRFWMIYILDQISFLGTTLGRFSQCFFYIFCRRPIMVADIFTQPPPAPLFHHHKKVFPTAL